MLHDRVLRPAIVSPYFSSSAALPIVFLYTFYVIFELLGWNSEESRTCRSSRFLVIGSVADGCAILASIAALE